MVLSLPEDEQRKINGKKGLLLGLYFRKYTVVRCY